MYQMVWARTFVDLFRLPPVSSRVVTVLNSGRVLTASWAQYLCTSASGTTNARANQLLKLN